ncbi:MAG: hypothetical protein ACK5O2_03900 [Microthrixaceae bacterium]
MRLDTVAEVLLVAPVVLVWVMALRYALIARGRTPRRRFGVTIALVLFPPLAVPYLLARPPVGVRRGAAFSDDPRETVVAALERAGGSVG